LLWVLSWATFTEAADQAGRSRRYGGIHFEANDLVGRQTGRLVADVVWNKAASYINGPSAIEDRCEPKLFFPSGTAEMLAS
jgi:hypothetical protein